MKMTMDELIAEAREKGMWLRFLYHDSRWLSPEEAASTQQHLEPGEWLLLFPERHLIFLEMSVKDAEQRRDAFKARLENWKRAKR